MSTTERSSQTAVAPEAPAAPRADAGVRRIVRRRATLRRLDPWSVLKLSLIFYFCLLLVFMLAVTLFWAIVNRLGVIETALAFLAELQVDVAIRGDNIARVLFLLGLLNVVLWSGVNVFVAFLYNLVADLVGGLRVTLGEEE